jgi:hypothetical protein
MVGNMKSGPVNPTVTAKRAALVVMIIGLVVFVPSAYLLAGRNVGIAFLPAFFGLVVSSWGFACWLGVSA